MAIVQFRLEGFLKVASTAALRSSDRPTEPRLSERARAQQRRPALFTHHSCPQERELRDDPVPAVLVSRLGRLVWRSTGP